MVKAYELSALQPKFKNDILYYWGILNSVIMDLVQETRIIEWGMILERGQRREHFWKEEFKQILNIVYMPESSESTKICLTWTK